MGYVIVLTCLVGWGGFMWCFRLVVRWWRCVVLVFCCCGLYFAGLLFAFGLLGCVCVLLLYEFEVFSFCCVWVLCVLDCVFGCFCGWCVAVAY